MTILKKMKYFERVFILSQEHPIVTKVLDHIASPANHFDRRLPESSSCISCISEHEVRLKDSCIPLILSLFLPRSISLHLTLVETTFL